jgi:hypothetical protein
LQAANVARKEANEEKKAKETARGSSNQLISSSILGVVVE